MAVVVVVVVVVVVDGVGDPVPVLPQIFQCRSRIRIVKRQVVFINAGLLQCGRGSFLDKPRPIGHQLFVLFQCYNV